MRLLRGSALITSTLFSRYTAREHDDIVPGGRVLRCIRRNYGDNLSETEGA